jgi:hypothetical protein
MSEEGGHEVEAREGCSPLQASAFRKVILLLPSINCHYFVNEYP